MRFAEKLPERNDVGELEMQENPLLKEVYEVNRSRLKDKNAPLPEGYESGHEIERRYALDFKAAGIKNLDDIDAFFESLLKIQNASKRMMTQVNVEAHHGTEKDRRKKDYKPLSYRFRKTWVIWPPGSSERKMYRLTLKEDTKPKGAKEETQLHLHLRGEDMEKRKEFDAIAERAGINPNGRERTYILVPLPTGAVAEIHVEKYFSEPLTDFPRIEIEFPSMRDLKYAQENWEECFGKYPWIGKDVTEDEEWKSKHMSQHGIPSEAREEFEAIKSASR